MNRRTLLRRLVLATLALAALAYGAALATLWTHQESLLFHPVPAAAAAKLDADVQETWVDVPGARLNVLRLRRPHPDGVVLYLHGNSGNLARWWTNLDVYRRLNLDLVMPDYRGFGRSSGQIDSQAQLESDMRAVWNAVAADYAGKRRIFLGRSLGTGLAATLAAEVQPELTVLVSPYSSMADMAAELYPWVPTALLRYPLRTDDIVPRIHGPLLLLHGDRDALIPAEHSRRLLARAPAARLVVVAGAGHGDIQTFPDYQQALEAAYLVPKILSPASPKPGMM